MIYGLEEEPAVEKPKRFKNIYVGKISPYASHASVGQMHATPAARAIHSQQSLAAKAKRKFRSVQA